MGKVRKSKKFSWGRVDDSLIRKLLEAAYEQFGPVDEAAKVPSLTPDQLRRQAERALGRPPKPQRWFDLTDTLRHAWLPHASTETLARLTATLNKYDPMATRKERIDFLLARNRTDAYVTNLWKAFVAAHKEAVEVTTRPGPGPRISNSSRVDLVGEATEPRHHPYDHQVQAWQELDRLRQAGGRRSGLIVIPTGGGKTATMTTWLISELQRRPKLRVLWIADQQELVDQAAREFEDHARTAPTSFQRRLRPIHGQAGAPSTLADPDVDVVCATRQSLMGKKFDAQRKKGLRAFLTRPTVVVIDEAHHAVSPTYQQLIDFLWEAGNGLMLVGLTATPWPSGSGQTAKLRKTFARELVSVATGELVAKGDLARPVIHTVATTEDVEVTAQELKKLTSAANIPPRLARQLDRETRNQLVVEQWIARKEVWGKTLVFACDIAHADLLVEAFREADVTAHVVHSSAGADRAEVLDRFRKATQPEVLVSVGMLLEGVDIPSARTAFLCRPTGSHIVMRQMIGRVLRGVHAGGDAEAHIVEFVDTWRDDDGRPRASTILSPADIPDVIASRTSQGEGAGEHQLPRIRTDDGVGEVGEDLVRSIARATAQLSRENAANAMLTGSRLVGFYDLDVRRIPVFESAVPAWADAAAWALDSKNKSGTSALSFFDDVPHRRRLRTRSQRLSPTASPTSAHHR